MKKYNYTEFILENMRIDGKKVHVYNVAYFCERLPEAGAEGTESALYYEVCICYRRRGVRIG